MGKRRYAFGGGTRVTSARGRSARALAAGAMLLLVAAPAGAAGEASYVASATATGLNLTLGGQGLTIGFSEAGAHSDFVEGESVCADDATTCARAAGELLFGETAAASAPGNEGPADATAFSLSDIDEGFDMLALLNIGTARASAGLDPIPMSVADAGAADLGITATQTLANEVPVQDILTEISDGLLGPIADGDPSGIAQRVKDTVDTLNDRLDETPIITVAAGPSQSKVTHEGNVTTATARAVGANIVLSPTLANLPFAPEGLVIIEVGAASATATTDETVGAASFDPALVRVRILDPATGEYDAIEVAPGQDLCVLSGTPLEVCISVGSGEVVQEGSAAAARANGVSIRLLADPLPVVNLDLAVAEARVDGAGPTDEPPPPPPPGPPNLPRTGPVAIVPLLGAAILSAAAAFPRRRF